MKVESILDKNITITPDVDETEHLISENSLSSYRKSYVSFIDQLKFIFQPVGDL